MRALIVVRRSRVTDATTSPERQLQACRDLCAQRGYEVVGIAEDLDVSGQLQHRSTVPSSATGCSIDSESSTFLSSTEWTG
ncbi:recombinase family protein [Mycobacterium asiaticum]|uniref:recombinase family protein n=1 Tax=Mycobacterium asiaticum TaxID=1790 RepID=UPI003F51886F